MHPVVKHTIPYAILFVSLLLGWKQTVWSQQTGSTLTLDNFVIKNYTRTDGLPNNLCTYTFCDSRGMIWIGSDEGLGMFDGNRFRKLYLGNGPVDLSGDRIVFITEDSHGQIWIVSTNSVDNYNPRTQTTRNYPFHLESHSAPPGFRSIFIKPGEPAWVFTSRGLYFLDLKNGRYSHYSEKMPRNKTFESNLYYDGWVFDKLKNRLWLGTYSGIACYDFNTRTLYNQEHNPEKAAIFNSTSLT